LWSHSYPISGHPEQEIFFSLFGGYDSGGGLAVSTFFVISGFLVTKSACRRDLMDYLVARGARILPGLAFVVVVTVLVIGPSMTNLSLSDYLSDPTTARYLLSATVFRIQYALADTTSTLPIASINGSLWTLPVECGFYVIILVLVKAGLRYDKLCAYLLALIVCGYLYVTRVLGINWDHQGISVWNGATLYATLTNGCFFMVGSAFWIYRAKVSLQAGCALLCVVIWFAAAGTAISPIVYLTCLPYLVIYVGLGVPLKIDLQKRLGDLSYGVYLFAFPLQQLIVRRLGSGLAPTSLSLLATPAALAIAYVSWHLVEKRALGLKKWARQS
jgi:peptidoglycan/LPS O-acetylase OafA/YrhL